MLLSLGILVVLMALLGLALLMLHQRAGGDNQTLEEAIMAVLPQTQCGQCQYPGCRPYAQALMAGEASPNQCPPGGNTTAIQLAELLGVSPQHLDDKLAPPPVEPITAFIHESACIGCALCLPVCPVDAIIGSRRYTHTIVQSLCTGCALCVAPCPVDCIEALPISVLEDRVALGQLQGVADGS